MCKVNEKMKWISNAKGFGILGIVAVHTVQRFNFSFISSIAFFGAYCVQLFFIISSYLTFLNLDNKNEEWTIKSYLKYFFHKIVRFIPVLYIATLWHAVMYCIEIGKIPEMKNEIWSKIFFSITFLNGFSYQFINPWMNWYIGTLVIFLAFAPLIKKIIDSPKKAVILFIVSSLIGSISTFLLKKQGIDITWYYYFWFPRQFPVMAVGIVFFFFEKYKYDYDHRKWFYIFFLIVTFGFLLQRSWRSFLEWHVQCGILIFAFSYTLFNKLEIDVGVLKSLGDNSLGIYLFHCCLLPIIAPLIHKIGFNRPSYSFILCYISVLLSSFVISRVVNIFIEKPFWSLTRKLFDV